MFKIFSSKGILKEGMPYIIVAVKRIKRVDYLDGFVLVNRLYSTLEPVLLTQRTNINYVSVELSEKDFDETQVLRMQLTWSKNQLSAWLYEQRKETFLLEQNLDWEELEVKNLILPLAVMVASDKRIHGKVFSIRQVTSCPELVDFLDGVLGLKLKIEKIDEG